MYCEPTFSPVLVLLTLHERCMCSPPVCTCGWCLFDDVSLVIRYKSLCPSTWPNWTGNPRDGVEALCKSVEFTPDQYKIGK